MIIPLTNKVWGWGFIGITFSVCLSICLCYCVRSISFKRRDIRSSHIDCFWPEDMSWLNKSNPTWDVSSGMRNKPWEHQNSMQKSHLGNLKVTHSPSLEGKVHNLCPFFFFLIKKKWMFLLHTKIGKSWSWTKVICASSRSLS